jgi:hypothetical protein
VLLYQHRANAISLLQLSGDCYADCTSSNDRVCKISLSCHSGGEAARLTKRFCAATTEHCEKTTYTGIFKDIRWKFLYSKQIQ